MEILNRENFQLIRYTKIQHYLNELFVSNLYFTSFLIV